MQLRRVLGSSGWGVLVLSLALVFCILSSVLLVTATELSHSSEADAAVRRFARDASSFSSWQQRDLLRVFGARGTQGMPFIPTPAPSNASTPSPTPTPLEYATPLIIVAAIGAGIGVLVLLFACFIWWCRCCCKRCCMGDTDPERNYLCIRLFVLGLGLMVLAAAFVGLYGGKSVSTSLRTTIDSMVLSLTNFGHAITILTDVAASYNFPVGDLAAIRSIISNFALYVGIARQYFTPIDAARLGILYGTMTVAMLASIGLFLGAILRRKEVIVVSLCSATIAIVIAWFSFAVNYPMAVAIDDSCVTLQQVLANTLLSVNGIQFLIGCLPPALFVDINGNASQAAIFLATRLQNAEQNANLINPSNFNPLTISSAAHQSVGVNMTALSQLMNSTLLATVTATASPPCSSTCVSGSFFSDLGRYRNLTEAVAALVTLQNCADIQRILDSLNGSVCQDLVVGILMVFVGAIVIGTLLIPMGIMGLYVSQKFPNRSAAARVKSRILVIFLFLFFHCLVAVLAEVNATWWELLITIGTIVVAALGFILINIPMNRLDWKIGSQICLALLLMVFMMACLGGWIYLFYYAVLNNVACAGSVTSFAGQIFQTLGQQIPVCNQSQYAHSLIVCIFAGTAMGMSALCVLLSLVFACKTGCGTPLNLEDSDYELD